MPAATDHYMRATTDHRTRVGEQVHQERNRVSLG